MGVDSMMQIELRPDTTACASCGERRIAITDKPPASAEEDRDAWREIARRLQDERNELLARAWRAERTVWLASLIIMGAKTPSILAEFLPPEYGRANG